MRLNLIILALIVAPFSGISQEKPQFEALLAEVNPAGPLLDDYMPELSSAEEIRRNYLEHLRNQIDTLNISPTKRYKIMRDIYQGKESPWVTKYQLKTDFKIDSI
jgi:hypothetical protein